MDLIMMLIALSGPVFHDTLRVREGRSFKTYAFQCTNSNPAYCISIQFIPKDTALSAYRMTRTTLLRFRDSLVETLSRKGWTLTKALSFPPADFSLFPKPAELFQAWGGYEYPVETSQGTLRVHTWVEYIGSTPEEDTAWPWVTPVYLSVSPVQDTLACFSSSEGEYCVHAFGHSHQEDSVNFQNKPVGEFVTDSGWFTSIEVETQPVEGGQPFCVARADVPYEAPEVSGIVKITAMVPDTGLQVTVYGYVGIEVGSSASIAGEVVYLVGGTCEHYGNLSPWNAGIPPWWELRCGLVDLNHALHGVVGPLYTYIMWRLAEDLEWLQVEVNDSAQACIVQPVYRIPVNDVSLPYGGAFDICGTWDVEDRCALARKGGHRSHRTGRTVDLNHKKKIQALNGSATETSEEERSQIVDIIEGLMEDSTSSFRGCFAYLHEGDHIHLWLHPLGRAGRLDSVLVRAQRGDRCFTLGWR